MSSFKTRFVEFEGQNLQLSSQQVKNKTWVHWRGQCLCLEDIPGFMAAKKNRKSQAQDDTGEILSPMPGKVSKILASPGDEVKKGQALIVMEAMKMEYTLKANASGKLSRLTCKVGDQVLLGQSLAVVKGDL